MDEATLTEAARRVRAAPGWTTTPACGPSAGSTREHGYLMDPHTAVAWKVAAERLGGDGPVLVVEHGALEQVRRRRRPRPHGRAGRRSRRRRRRTRPPGPRHELAPDAAVPASLQAVRDRPCASTPAWKPAANRWRRASGNGWPGHEPAPGGPALRPTGVAPSYTHSPQLRDCDRLALMMTGPDRQPWEHQGERIEGGRLLVAGRDAEELAREHGTPLYVFDVTRVAEQARALYFSDRVRDRFRARGSAGRRRRRCWLRRSPPAPEPRRAARWSRRRPRTA